MLCFIIDGQMLREMIKKLRFYLCIYYLFFKKLLFLPLTFSPDGGNGRRAWLRAMFSQGSASSILVLGTISGYRVGVSDEPLTNNLHI